MFRKMEGEILLHLQSKQSLSARSRGSMKQFRYAVACWLSFLLLKKGEKIVKVKSLRPGWGEHGMEWPTLLIDSPGRSRATVSYCWTRGRFRDVWWRLRGWDEQKREAAHMVIQYGPDWHKPVESTSTATPDIDWSLRS